METLLADIRQTIRGFTRSPGFATAAIAVLALGLAGNTAVFSVADAILFKPLAYERPEQLVAINEIIPQFSKKYPLLPVNAAHFFEWRTRTRSFADLAILQNGSLNLTGNDGPPERLGVEYASANLLPLMGVRPMLGRNFTEEEDRRNNDRVVILMEPVWRRRFHSDPAILNKSILLSGRPHLVIGVMPPSFHFPRPDLIAGLGGSSLPIDLFKPIAIDRSKLEKNGNFNFNAIGRLRSGVSRQQALEDLNAVQTALTREISSPGMDLRSDITILQERITAGSRRGLLMLLASIGVVLLVVCVNLGNLMLARATARSREMAVRTALGASVWRMVRQVLTESLAISLAGGVIGTVLAYAAVRALVATAPVELPRLDEVHLDYRALLFALAASVVAGLLFGLVPAWRAARAEPQEALRAGGRSATQGRHGLRVSEFLVSAEVALSAALLVAAGLLVGSLMRILSIDQGFRADNVLTASVYIPGAKYPDSKKRLEFYDRLLPRIQQLPGVQSAALISALPLQGETWIDMITRDDDHRPMFQRPVANYRFISPDYFAAMGIPIRQGRPFQPSDRGKPVFIISASTAEQIWPGQNPIGKRMRKSNDKDAFGEVIGVVTDTRAEIKSAAPMMVFLPYWTEAQSGSTIVIRTAQDPRSAAGALRSAIWSVDSDLPVPEMKTMRQVVSNSVAQRRFQALLLGGFAGAALLLAAIGIYGVISYSVTRRRNEIGIRVALGASRRDVSGMVLRQGMRPVAIGLLIGLASAVALGRLLQVLLYEIHPSNPLVLTTVALLLGLTAALACYIPARRATAIDPATALRYE
jgi:putative ABC transport system permease protein